MKLLLLTGLLLAAATFAGWMAWQHAQDAPYYDATVGDRWLNS